MKGKKKLQLAFFCIGVLMLSACKKNSTINMEHTLPLTSITPAVPLPTPEQVGLLGDWNTGCEESTGVNGYPKGYHYLKNYHITNDKITETIHFYPDPATGYAFCANVDLALFVEYFEDIKLGLSTIDGSDDQHININITKTKVILAPFNDDMTKLLNSGTYLANVFSGYGMTWTKFEPGDVTGKEDANKRFNIGTMVPDIFQISEMTVNGQTVTVLKMGDKQGDLDQNGRPIMLEKIYAEKV
ncbi:MAG: hypothetical protein KAH18_04840 [Psychromonas sp.]|nr:hypothetical protein [Psychromonas sp.]